MTEEFAKEFSRNWLASWNSHNIDEISEHYSEDFFIETPIALKLFPESNGCINGLTIYYINLATNKKSVEVMNFNKEGKVDKAIVHYEG